jgi:signal transduction histidine kinase
MRIQTFSETSLNGYDGSQDDENLTEGLKALLKSSSVDAVLVMNGQQEFSIEAISTSEDFIMPESDYLKLLYEHPYIRLYRTDNNLYMIGTVSLAGEKGPAGIYLIKHINESFLKNIAFDSEGRILFHTADSFLTGNFSSPEILFHTGVIKPESAYSEQFALPYRDSSYNIATAKCGIIGKAEEEDIAYLSTILSNEPFIKRIYNIERTILTVSLLTMLITAVLSMLISRGISRPVSSLAGAMDHIRSGTYTIRLNHKPRDEIGVLMQGFNDMASQLHQDQVELENSLNEITFLSEYNERVINSIRDAIAVINEKLEIEKANLSFRTIFPDLTGLCAFPFDENVQFEIEKVIQGKQEYFSQRIRGGNEKVFELKTYPLHREESGGADKELAVVLLEDISEKNAYEEKIFQAEKLSSISMLSAGIAHEINNPLSSILTNTQNLIYSEEDGDKLEILKLVEDESHRIARIIRDLLDLTSQEQNQVPAVNPLDVANEVRRLIRHSRKKNGDRVSELHIHCEDEIPRVGIPKGELMQLYINLLQNAIHASSGNEPIFLEIRTAEDNSMVSFQIRDRGTGIESSHLKRVFDPFFTTKSNREGTGLGLSVVYGIIMKYQGSVDISSVPGEGTTVSFELPAEKDFNQK